MPPELNLDHTLNKPGRRQTTETPIFGFSILGDSRGCGASFMFFFFFFCVCCLQALEFQTPSK